VLRGDIADAVAALKQQDGGDVHVIGSAELVRSLIEHDLVDELRLMIDPLLLGGGKGIFRRRRLQAAAAGRRRADEYRRDPRDLRTGRVEGRPRWPG
jgi:dihydrofolate reductase